MIGRQERKLPACHKCQMESIQGAQGGKSFTDPLSSLDEVGTTKGDDSI